MKKLYIATALIVSFATPAFAGHCPKDVKRIDEAISVTEGLSTAQITKINTLRDEGEMLHKTGSHSESLDALHKALVMLGIEPH
ncbi:MAG: hypothetical protein HRU33_23875 [Rhodobacteraceae bacterium]|nr:hypothetical protein [Paracoccaceae bacterium]